MASFSYLPGGMSAFSATLHKRPTAGIANTSGYVLDLDASEANVDVNTDGASVGSWTDTKSSKAFTQGTAANKPTWNETDANFNNTSSITFDGADDFLKLSEGFLTGSSGAIFAVLRVHSNTTSTDIFFASSDEASTTIYNNFQIRGDLSYAFSSQDGPSNWTTDDTLDLQTTYIVATIAHGANTQTINFWNRVERDSATLNEDPAGRWWGALNTDALDNVTIGALRTTGAANHCPVDIARILVYDGSTVTKADAVDIMDELNDTYSAY